MKHLKRIIVWIILSVVIQFSVLLYLNNYLLSTDGNSIKTKKVETIINKVANNQEINIPIGATQIAISYDGSYVAYYENEFLNIINNGTGELKQLNFEEGSKVSFYKWLPDRNRMLITEKMQSIAGQTLKLSQYDVDKKEKVEEKSFTLVDSKSEVNDIALSTLSNVIYIKAANSVHKATIYYLNVMKEMKKVETKGYIVGNIEAIPHESTLVYEDSTNSKVYVTNTSNPISIKGVTKLALLSVDSDDNIYVGQLEAGKIMKMYSGNLKDTTSKWKVTELMVPVNTQDIHVSENGDMYINDNLMGIITEVLTGNTTKYQGKLLSLYEGGVASISQGKLIKTSLK